MGSDIEIQMGTINPPELGLEPKPPVQEPAQREQNCWGWFCGRIFKDWTQPVSLFLTFGGIVGAAAGVVLDDTYIIIAGTASVVASAALSCGRISCLKPQKKLEKRVEDLGNEVGRLERNVEKLIQIWKELKEAQEEAQLSIARLGEVLKVPVDGMKNVTEQLKAIEEKLRALVVIYHSYKEAIEAFRKDLKQFKETNKVTKESVARLGKGVDDLDRNEDELSEEIDEYQSVVQYCQKQNIRLRNVLSDFKKDFVQMQQRFVSMQEDLGELKNQIEQLKRENDKFREGGEGFQQGVQDLQELGSKLEEKGDELKQKLEFLEEDTENFLTELDADEKDGKSAENTENGITEIIMDNEDEPAEGVELEEVKRSKI